MHETPQILADHCLSHIDWVHASFKINYPVEMLYLQSDKVDALSSVIAKNNGPSRPQEVEVAAGTATDDLQGEMPLWLTPYLVTGLAEPGEMLNASAKLEPATDSLLFTSNK